MTGRGTRAERGAVQRANLRRLVAGDGQPTRRYDSPDDTRELAAAAAWWARQDQWGSGVTAPAEQIASTIEYLQHSPNPAALQFELGRLVLSYSRSLVRELGGAARELSPALPDAQNETARQCIRCQADALAQRWIDHEFAFLRVSCSRCATVATTARFSDSARVNRLSVPVDTDVRQRRLLFAPHTVTAVASLNARLLDVAADEEGRLAVPIPEPETGSETGSARFVASADLVPCVLLWG